MIIHQLHGTAVGSPLSFRCCSRKYHAEHRGTSPGKRTLPLWLRYIDDTFTAVDKDEIDDFHEHLNRQNGKIQFTRRSKKNTFSRLLSYS